MNQQPPIKLGPGGDFTRDDWCDDDDATPVIAMIVLTVIVIVFVALAIW